MKGQLCLAPPSSGSSEAESSPANKRGSNASSAKKKGRSASRRKKIVRRALRVKQDGDPLYLLALTGQEILEIAEISRLGRSNTNKLIGYQRPEVKRHIRNITDYLDSERVLFPNSLILAFSSSVTFKQSRGPKVGGDFAIPGTLEIPVPKNGDPKPAWIVDGQQRAIALSKAKRQDLPVPVNAFVADNVDLQRDQFLRINNSNPLPRGLITELLPEVSTLLPPNLAAKKVPSAVCDVLNQDPESPFCGLIRRSSTSGADRKKAVITDTAIIHMLHDSFSSPQGCLFPYRNLATGETDFPGIRSVLFLFWSAVKETFPEAWGRSPKQSRLMHGAGIRAVGKLMDRIMGSFDVRRPRAAALVRRELNLVKPICHWTDGSWEELGGLRWNEIQNVPKHIRALSNLLLRNYLMAKQGA